jgi:cytochrome o ubiquinol oxidase subunit 1
MLGRLNIEAFQHDLVVMGAVVSMSFALIAIVAGLTYFKKWGYLWREWLTSLDHKKIGIMYIAVSSVMLLRGVMDALLMRVQQAIAADSNGLVSSDHFQQIFSAHGTIMIFFVAMGLMFGLINTVLPQMLGARDVAFPFLNSVSFWLFAAGAILMNVSLAIGEFSAAGWLAYPPLSGLEYSPGVGVDYWIWSLQISGVGSLLSGINFLVTILTMRAPGMTLMRMPIFAWSVLGSMVLVIFAFPVLTATLGMLSFDRLFGMNFFTSDLGGNPMMYVNLIWAWGHPEVYIVALPAFGMFSEIVASFSRKKIFGYKSMVVALIAITILSYVVWLHHFFTMGAGPFVNTFFGIMTMIIAVPTGVKVFNWLFTMYKGKVMFSTPMLWFMGFIFSFTIGGVTGVLLAVPAIDFQFHNSLFLVAHFHNMLIGVVVFGYFAGLYYWFPKIFGFTLNEALGKLAFVNWITGFALAFIPLYILGIMGATRRLDNYDASTGWQPLFIVAGVGLVFILIGIFFQVLQLAHGIWKRKENRDETGDAWGVGRTLEWATPSPTPFYNFATIPKVVGIDTFWDMNQNPKKYPKQKYADIELPKNTPFGIYIGAAAGFAGFALVWHIWWLAIVSLVALVACIIVRSFDDEPEYRVSAQEISAYEAAVKKGAVL